MTAPLTEEKIAELEALEKAATSGPWKECRANEGKCICGVVWSESLDLLVASATKDAVDAVFSDETVAANAALIAAARNALPALLQAARENNKRLIQLGEWMVGKLESEKRVAELEAALREIWSNIDLRCEDCADHSEIATAALAKNR